MNRFTYCRFWHPGRGLWIDSCLNIDQIARAQLDMIETDKVRVWMIGDDVGILTDWSWTDAATLLGVSLTQPATLAANSDQPLPAPAA